MANYAAVLRKTIDALAENTPEARARIYERARSTIEAKLAAVSSAPEVVARQKELLDDAINTIEAEYGDQAGSDAPDDVLGDVFAGLGAPAERSESAEDSFQEHLPSEVGGNTVDQGSEDAGDVGGETPSAHEPSADADKDDDVDAVQQEPVSDGEAQPAISGPEADVSYSATDHWHGDVEDGTASPADQTLQRSDSRRSKILIPLLLLLIALGAASFGGWYYRDDLTRLAGSLVPAETEQQPDQAAPAADEEDQPTQAADAENGEASPEQGAAPSAGKFTQRLLPDGQEVDEGPAGDESTLGEGTSVATATQTGTPPAQGETQGDEQAVPVGQSAIFYEERTNSAEGSAQRGTVVWSTAEESPGDNLPPEPVIRAEARVPGKDLQLKMTVRRNVDQSLPASHIIELIFLTPDNFGGGGVNNVLRVAMKRTEQDTGSPLLGIPAKIADGFFLVALNDSRADLEANSTLMRRQSWIDIPIVYTSGRRALITLEKGVPGERIFDEALEAWSQAATADSGNGG